MVTDAAYDSPVVVADVVDGGALEASCCADAAVDPTGDVALDGQTMPDASTTWCQLGTHQFCADFDSDPYTAGWTDQIAAGTGKISMNTTGSRSMPGAFLSEISAPDVVDPQARLRKLFAPRPTKISLEFDLFLDDPRLQGGPPGQPVEIFSIMQEGEQYSTGLKLLRGGSTQETYLLYQRVDGGSLFSMKGSGLATGRWVHVALTFDPPGTSNQGQTGSVELEVDGMTLANYPRVIDLDYHAATATATVLSVGLGSIATQDLAMSAKYDNVTVDVIP